MKPSRRVLVVDDDRAMGEMVAALLDDEGIAATRVESVDEALAACEVSNFDIVLSDIRMPGRSGIELVAEMRDRAPELPVVLMTAFGSIDSAVDAMRAGAFHYVTKPFQRDEVLAVLERAFEFRALQDENTRLRRAVDDTTAMGDLLGASPAMREVFATVRKIANSRANVLITGESGTGKEVVSRTLHFTSSRSDQPFVPINCTAIPEGLLESELFGHVRGAFTGADADHEGLFEKADGGTLFLDEIGDMGASLQSKLLRVLQDGEVRRVGSTTARKVDVRIVAATNKDLRAEIDAGHFRRDLFYRLNVIPIKLAPLRERPEDVAVLARAFVEKHAGGEARTLSEDAIALLSRCAWEGNARELENVLERSLALSSATTLGAQDIVLSSDSPDARATDGSSAQGFFRLAISRGTTLRELEAEYTDEVLRFTNGNKSEAAKILGINRRTLYRREDREADDDAEA